MTPDAPTGGGPTEGEARDAFLLTLTDALRPLADADAIQAEACRLLAERLDVARAYYVEVDERAGVARVRRDFVRVGASLSGDHRVSDFGWSVAILRRGACHIIADTRTSPLIPDTDRPASLALDIIACAGTPLIKSGRLVGALCVTDSRPRQWTDAEIALLRDVGERIWAAVERARAEEALRASEERYRFLFTRIDQGFCTIEVLFDATGEPFDYRFIEINPAFVRHTGIENGVGRTVREFAPDLERFWFEAYGRIARTGEAQRFEHAAAGLNPPRHYDVFAFRVGTAADNRVAVLFNDITERKRTEQALRESEARLRLFVTASSDIVYRMSADWTQMLSLEGKRFLVDTQDARRTWLEEYIPESDRALVKTTVANAIRERTTFELEHRVIRANGTIGWVFSRAVPFLDASGDIREWFGAASDISDRKHAELELREAHAELEQRVAERTAALAKVNLSLQAEIKERRAAEDQIKALFKRLVVIQEEERRRIARDIHDQLGQQMTALRMNLEALTSRAGTDNALSVPASRAQKLAAEIDRSVDFLMWELRPAALDHLGLAAALERLVAGWSERFGIGAAFDAGNAGSLRLLPDAEANLFRLSQEALHNIAKHAAATRVEVSLRRNRDTLLVSIEDNGRGFVVSDAWERHRASGRLGLASMAERAALIGGTLDIESEPGRGTAIFVRVPIVPSGTDAP